MDIAELRRRYPPGFPVEALPAGAKCEQIKVYRVCRSGKVEPASFLPTYLDEISKTKENFGKEFDIGDYSLSTFANENDARRILKFFRGKNPVAILSIGCTEPSCGLCQRTKERKKSKHNKSHIDWWLYQGAEPYIYFQEV